MNSKISSDELTSRAFQLAYFLHCDRKTATEIATRALNKLQLAATAQSKRHYYRLTGREDSRKARSKVSLGEPHLLQRLVYVESEEFERLKELAAHNLDAQSHVTPAQKSDLVVYFIKHLVRITTRRNSFYVTLGLSRLLYNYTTSETMELYNLVIQDPDRVHDDYYYRSRKGVLLKELKERFGSLIEVTKGARGEQRWQASDDASPHGELVRDCLVQFTPWATPCVVPQRFDPLSETIDQLNFYGRQADEEHEVEVNRIHATLHPDCFARLVAANRLAGPDERLELPHDHENMNGSSRKPPNLSPDDVRNINDLLAHEALRRKAASATFFRVLVDGRERAEIIRNQTSTASFRVDDGSELIEIYTDDSEGALLLATHLLDFNGSDRQESAITLENGQQITFTTKLLVDEAGSPTGAEVVVNCKETAPFRIVSSAISRMFGPVFGTVSGQSRARAWWKPAAGLAALAVLIAGVWWNWFRQRPENRRPDQQLVLVPSPAPINSPTVELTPAPNAPGQKQPEPNRNTKPGTSSAPPVLAQRDATPAHDETFVERSVVADNTGDGAVTDTGVRGWNREVMGKPLGEVRRVFLQNRFNNSESQVLLAELRAKLSGGGTVQFAESDAADASIKFSVQPASSRAGDKRVIAIVRAVNANGYVVWPVARRSSSIRYVGLPSYVAERVVRDLSSALQAPRDDDE
jgi:hypothetical protein